MNSRSPGGEPALKYWKESPNPPLRNTFDYARLMDCPRIGSEILPILLQDIWIMLTGLLTNIRRFVTSTRFIKIILIVRFGRNVIRFEGSCNTRKLIGRIISILQRNMLGNPNTLQSRTSATLWNHSRIIRNLRNYMH